ncbi:MAG: STAS domain-containing protein [Bacteroidota bacterium]
MKFKYQIIEKSGLIIILFRGNLLENNQTMNLSDDIEHLLVQKKNNFILDLSELKHINSSGLGEMVKILTKSRKSGGETILANVSEKIKTLFITTKLNTIFTITDSVEEAAEKLTAGNLQQAVDI